MQEPYHRLHVDITGELYEHLVRLAGPARLKPASLAKTALIEYVARLEAIREGRH